MKTMHDVPLTATIEQTNYAEVAVDIITTEDGTLWIHTVGSKNLTGPYNGDEWEAMTQHFQRGE